MIVTLHRCCCCCVRAPVDAFTARAARHHDIDAMRHAPLRHRAHTPRYALRAHAMTLYAPQPRVHITMRARSACRHAAILMPRRRATFIDDYAGRYARARRRARALICRYGALRATFTARYAARAARARTRARCHCAVDARARAWRALDYARVARTHC